MTVLKLIGAYLGIGALFGVGDTIYTWLAVEKAKREMVPWAFVLLAAVLKELLFWPFSFIQYSVWLLHNLGLYLRPRK
jgi:hypothetical protein